MTKKTGSPSADPRDGTVLLPETEAARPPSRPREFNPFAALRKMAGRDPRPERAAAGNAAPAEGEPVAAPVASPSEDAATEVSGTVMVDPEVHPAAPATPFRPVPGALPIPRAGNGVASAPWNDARARPVVAPTPGIDRTVGLDSTPAPAPPTPRGALPVRPPNPLAMRATPARRRPPARVAPPAPPVRGGLPPKPEYLGVHPAPTLDEAAEPAPRAAGPVQPAEIVDTGLSPEAPQPPPPGQQRRVLGRKLAELFGADDDAVADLLEELAGDGAEIELADLLRARELMFALSHLLEHGAKGGKERLLIAWSTMWSEPRKRE